MRQGIPGTPGLGSPGAIRVFARNRECPGGSRRAKVNGASVGVETDRGSTFIAGMAPIVEAPCNDLWAVPGEEERLAALQAEDRARFAGLDPGVSYHGLQIQEFLAAARVGRTPLVTGEDGRAVVELTTAIYQSHRERRAITLPLPAKN